MFPTSYYFVYSDWMVYCKYVKELGYFYTSKN